MTRLAAALMSLSLLAACGADGEPVRPSLNAGVGISNKGVSVGATAGVSAGPVRVSVGIF